MSLCFLGSNEDGVAVSVIPVTSVKSIEPSGNGMYRINFLDGTHEHLSSYSVTDVDLGMSILGETVFKVKRSYDASRS